MAKVTIEGSLSPSTYLARGERREVQRDQHVDALIAGGYVNVISEEGEVEPTPLPEPAKAPAKSAGREAWAGWLAEHTDIVTEGKNRDALAAEYEDWLATHDAPAAE